MYNDTKEAFTTYRNNPEQFLGELKMKEMDEANKRFDDMLWRKGHHRIELTEYGSEENVHDDEGNLIQEATGKVYLTITNVHGYRDTLTLLVPIEQLDILDHFVSQSYKTKRGN